MNAWIASHSHRTTSVKYLSMYRQIYGSFLACWSKRALARTAKSGLIFLEVFGCDNGRRGCRRRPLRRHRRRHGSYYIKTIDLASSAAAADLDSQAAVAAADSQLRQLRMSLPSSRAQGG